GITFARVVRSCRQVRAHGHRLRCHTTTQQHRVAHLAHGHRTPVRGWFATADGTALGHVRVRIRTAPNDGANNWHTVRTVTTAANGNWHVALPTGPSRLIEAVYPGGPMTERASSPLARVLVAASSTLQFPRVVHFGQ